MQHSIALFLLMSMVGASSCWEQEPPKPLTKTCTVPTGQANAQAGVTINGVTQGSTYITDSNGNVTVTVAANVSCDTVTASVGAS